MIGWGLFSHAFGSYYVAHPAATVLVPRPIFNIFLALTYGQSGKYYEDFAVGMLVSTLYIASRNASTVSAITQFLRRHCRWFWGCGVGLLFFLCVWYVFPWKTFLTPAIGPHALLVEPGFALGFGLCVLALLFGSGIYKRVLSWRPICSFGDMSYSLYIWHLPILLLFKDVVLGSMPGLGFWHAYGLYWLCVAGAVIPFAFLCYRFVEMPGMNLAHRNRQKEARARMQAASLVDKVSNRGEVVDVGRGEVAAERTALVREAAIIRTVRLVMYK
jgi:peptidoglycan/LPS O-acetylase OafA/YrhL